ncbi:tRNA (adenosine(37)-N6)-threonylcarbamoyltransferase complex ATPase subunit type 1 TsaE [Sphingomonas sp. Sph1(2015)]|jgi:tRNA threonylcarbamoyladenosine biosynthesis protein TsaE|uniref:tRNA (adenosine(37)-N6)-threonylcarbamoyltransferase complex ATPase subunit type 1 TsaE n=1 Tax=Sphingomonas sp. Sph1(2015) TaxID=1628084 RepID=UPI000976EFD8|nr:tRNA (adenosine(37)-N6)-threonylcarbamoyltransferase complex ATPase subunit type 1 TsaE [Sphingomonas sp. Sph1(2015)]OMJ31403.1 tRNA (adenosine(37)-N6)-threonylcarbamoyltransferase complex ATPase subunit type 1 TsaE [Sphingomonas sp. Sph1(2015)]
MTIRLADAAATEEFGRRLAAHIRPGDVVTLTGTLGAGKTSLARGLLAALGLPGEAPSPSFAIVQPYAPPETVIPVLHVDLYRLDGPEQMEELGLDEALWDSALIVEWPDRAGEGAWPQALALTLEMAPDGGRILTAKIPSGWENRWPI